MAHSVLTVAKLRKLLDEFDDTAEVWVSSDEEGNSFGAPTIEGVDGEKAGPMILYPGLPRELPE